MRLESNTDACVEVVCFFEEAIVDVRYLEPGQGFSVGPNGDLPTVAVGKTQLIGWDGSAHVLQPGQGMSVELSAGSSALPLQPTRIVDAVSARVEMGAAAVLVRPAEPPQRQAWPFTLSLREHAWTAAAAVGALLMLLFAYSLPPDPKSLSVENFLGEELFIHMTVRPEEPPPGAGATGLADAKSQSVSKKAAGQSGKLGKPGAEPKNARFQLAGHSDLQLAHKWAEKYAAESTMIAFFRGAEGSHIAALWAEHDSALGDAADNVMGNITGIQPGLSDGVPYGLAPIGSGPGGGGDGHTIGLGDRGECKTKNCFGTIPGPGGPGGGGPGFRTPGLGPDKHQVIAPQGPQVEVSVPGVLDKSIIRRVIHQHQNEVRFCYEQKLLSNRSLEGRVMVQFVIAGTGRVLSAGVLASTMPEPSVAQCIAQAVHRWEFPQPKNGGTVMVSYPFVLRPAGN
jgi:TonB family protein